MAKVVDGKVHFVIGRDDAAIAAVLAEWREAGVPDVPRTPQELAANPVPLEFLT